MIYPAGREEVCRLNKAHGVVLQFRLSKHFNDAEGVAKFVMEKFEHES